MALQAIRRPDIAQGPLHDALLEMYPTEYNAEIQNAETAAEDSGLKNFVVMVIRRLSSASKMPLFYTRPIEDIDVMESDWRLFNLSPRVITYVTRAGDERYRRWESSRR